MGFNFVLPDNTICDFIPEVCEGIIQAYMAKQIVCPITPEGWKEIAWILQQVEFAKLYRSSGWQTHCCEVSSKSGLLF